MKKQLFLLVMMLLPMVVSAETVRIGGINYILTSNSKVNIAEVNGGSITGDLVIPESVNYMGKTYIVTSVGGFEGHKITSVYIPNTVTTIGMYAFRYCYDLKSVVIGSKVSSIGDFAFAYCTSLSSIKIDNDNTIFDSREDCNAIIRKSSNTLIQGCSTTIIPNSVTMIGDWAFASGRIPETIIIPDNVTSIGQWAFAHGQGLKYLTIGNGITTIQRGAFAECKELVSVIIPNNLLSVEERAFEYCNENFKVIISDISAWCNISFNGESSNPLAFAHNLYINEKKITDLIIPNGVKTINSYTFYGCNEITSITLPESISSVGYLAFGNSPDIKDVYCYAYNLPQTNTHAFKYSYIDYATLHVPESALDNYRTTSPWSEFGTIKSFSLKDDIMFADATVKALCMAWWDTNHDGELSKEEAAAVTDLGTVFKGNTNITSFDELQYFTGLKGIGTYAFSGCTGLTSVTIPNSVTTIGSYAFDGCI